jgi:dipeptidyl aminopeptidase/acylaminoacyl peptidase
MIKDVNLRVDGLKIVGQLYLPEGREPPYPAVILCHGIPSVTVDPTDGGYPLLAETISRDGLAVYTFRFRGSGESEGNFDIAGWDRDLQAAIDYLYSQPEIDNSRIALVGFSAGAALSIYRAANDKRVSAVVACAAPADFRSISDAENPSEPVNYFRRAGIIRDTDFPPSIEDWINSFRKINPLKVVNKISPRPLLLVHATGDSVVNVENTENLYARSGEPREKLILDGGEHRLRKDERAVEAIIKWLKAQFSK